MKLGSRIGIGVGATIAVVTWAKLTYAPGTGLLGSWRSPSLDAIIIVDTKEKSFFDKNFKPVEPAQSTKRELEKIIEQAKFPTRYLLAVKTAVPRDLVAYPNVSINATNRAYRTILLPSGIMNHSLHVSPLPDLSLGTPTVLRVTLPDGQWKTQFSAFWGKDQAFAKWDPKVTDQYARLYIDQAALGNKKRRLQGYSQISDYTGLEQPLTIATSLPVESLRVYADSRIFQGLRYHTQDLVADEMFELPTRAIEKNPTKPELRAIFGEVTIDGNWFNAQWDRHGQILAEPKFSGRESRTISSQTGKMVQVALPGDWISSTVYVNSKPLQSLPWGDVVDEEFVRPLYWSREDQTKSVHLEFVASDGPPVFQTVGTLSSNNELSRLGAYRFVRQANSPLTQVEFSMLSVDSTAELYDPNTPIERQMRFFCRTLDEQGNVLSYNLAQTTKEFGVYRADIPGSFSKPTFAKLEILRQRMHTHSIGTLPLQPDLSQVVHAQK